MKTSRRPKRARRQAIPRIRRNPSENEQKIPLYVVGRLLDYEGWRYIAIYDNEFDAMQEFLSWPGEDSYSFSSTWILGPVYFGDNISRKLSDDSLDDIDKWAAGDRSRMAALRKLRELASRSMSYGDD